MLRLSALAALAAGASAHLTPTKEGAAPQFTLIKLGQDAINAGAVCLDGSVPGFYWQPGVGADANKYMLYHEGGGWCYSPYDCLGRSKTSLGSSNSWAPTMSSAGMMSNDCVNNPLFCNWAKVYMKYCDGDSFSGDVTEPVVVNGTTIYMRGKRILDALLTAASNNIMNATVPLAAASKVVLTGCSAGGLATYMHADYVGQTYVKPGQDYHVIPISGFFLDHPNVEGVAVYPAQMRNVFYMQNATGGTNQACIAAMPQGQEWKCNMAPHIYPFIQSRIFPLNSFYDSWQSGCVLTSEPVQPGWSTANGNCSAVPGWNACARNPDSCDNDQIQAYNAFRGSFIDAYNAGPANKAGNGVFLTSCHTHCEAQNVGFWQFSIGGTSMEAAVGGWLNSTGNDPAQSHSFVDCSYNTGGDPRNCNPSCGAGFSTVPMTDY